MIADIHYVPVASSITLKAGQTTAEIRVTPIDDTLANGNRMLLFQIVPNPTYRVASKQLGAARMTFLDDDCPHVGISLVKDATPQGSGRRTFQVTAQPAPRRDTEIAYSVGGTAIGGVDYEALPGTVIIAAGETSATIVIKPYKPARSAEQTRPAQNKTVVLTLPHHQFTYFDFYRYLTQGRPRTASVLIASSDASPAPPKPDEATSGQSADAAVEKLRGEVSRLGWIVFTARSNGPTSDFDLFVMRPDGSDLRNITNTPKFDEYSPLIRSTVMSRLDLNSAAGLRGTCRRPNCLIRARVGPTHDARWAACDRRNATDSPNKSSRMRHVNKRPSRHTPRTGGPTPS